MSKRKSILVNSCLSMLSVILFFGSLEIYARYKYWGGSYREKGFYSRGAIYTPKSETSLRVVCVGGSTTHGGGRIEHYEAYPYYLEELLNEKFGKNYAEVLNSGLSGRPTEFHRDFIKQRIGDQELDIIVLHSLYNHFSSFYPTSYDPKIDKIFIERNSIVRTKYNYSKMSMIEITNIFLMEHSYFYTRLREKIARVMGGNLGDYYAKKMKFSAGEDEYRTYRADSVEEKNKILTSFISRFHKAIEEIILTAKSRNVDVALVIPPYPFFGEDYTGDVTNYRPHQYFCTVFEKGKQVLVELGEKYNLLVIDADAEFIRIGRSPDYFEDSVHLTPKGNKVLARIIASKMIPYLEKKKGLIEKPLSHQR